MEIYHGGSWRSICDLNFGNPDLVVACKQLGYTGIVDLAREGQFGVSSGQIWPRSLDCKGDESSIADCHHDPFGDTSTCSHRHDVGIICGESHYISYSYNNKFLILTELSKFSTLRKLLAIQYVMIQMLCSDVSDPNMLS